MAFNWKDLTQKQLAGMPQNTGMQALSAMQPQQNALLTGSNPNPKFPRARDAWERFKQGSGQFLFGQPGGLEQVSTVTPQQQGILQLLQQLGIYGLQNPYEGFEGIEQQARRQFNEQTVPSLYERFAGMGNNALSSGTLTSQLSQAGAGLESDLAAQKAQYGQQNMQQILQLLQLGLNPQTENVYRPGQNGVTQNAILSLIRSLTPSFGG